VLLREQPLHDDAIARCGAVEQRSRRRLLLGVERPCARSRLRLGGDAVA